MISKLGRIHRIDGHRDLHVAELANIEMTVAESFGPSQKAVACGLHNALSHGHTLAMISEATGAGISLEHRRSRFLELEQYLLVIGGDSVARAYSAIASENEPKGGAHSPS